MSQVIQQSVSPLSTTTCSTYVDSRYDSTDLGSPASSANGIGRGSMFVPSPKFPVLPPTYKHPHAILAQSRGHCENAPDLLLSPSEAMRIFIRGIEALPDDILRDAVFEKYALAERSRHQLLLATWDLEGTKRRIHTLERIQRYLETSHFLSDSEFKHWLSMYTDRGLPDLKGDALFYGNQVPHVMKEADRDATELTVMVENARARGLDVDSYDSDHEAGKAAEDMSDALV